MMADRQCLNIQEYIPGAQPYNVFLSSNRVDGGTIVRGGRGGRGGSVRPGTFQVVAESKSLLQAAVSSHFQS